MPPLKVENHPASSIQPSRGKGLLGVTGGWNSLGTLGWGPPGDGICRWYRGSSGPGPPATLHQVQAPHTPARPPFTPLPSLCVTPLRARDTSPPPRLGRLLPCSRAATTGGSMVSSVWGDVPARSRRRPRRAQVPGMGLCVGSWDRHDSPGQSKGTTLSQTLRLGLRRSCELPSSAGAQVR